MTRSTIGQAPMYMDWLVAHRGAVALHVARMLRVDAAEPGGGSTGMLASVHVSPAFRQLLIGTLATNSAFWMYQVAVGWLALELTDSAAFVGLAGFVSGIPLLVLLLNALF